MYGLECFACLELEIMNLSSWGSTKPTYVGLFLGTSYRIGYELNTGWLQHWMVVTGWLQHWMVVTLAALNSVLGDIGSNKSFKGHPQEQLQQELINGTAEVANTCILKRPSLGIRKE